MADVDISIINELRADESNAKKNKYLKFPSPAMFNEVLDVIRDSKEGPKILATFFEGGEETAAKNESIQKVIDNLQKVAQSTDGAAKETLEEEIARLEKKLGKGRKLSMKFVLKFLLQTSSVPAIQKIAERIE